MNKLDRERASFQRALESIHGSLGRRAVAIQVPIGEEKDFKGVVDLLTMQAHMFEPGGSGQATVQDIPADLKDEATSQREKLMEMVAEMDDALLEKYFENGELSDDEFLDGLRAEALKCRERRIRQRSGSRLRMWVFRPQSLLVPLLNQNKIVILSL